MERSEGAVFYNNEIYEPNDVTKTCVRELFLWLLFGFDQLYEHNSIKIIET